MPLGIPKTAKAYLIAGKYTFSYSPLVLWWPPLSHFKEKRYFSGPLHGFRITYNLPNTVNEALQQGSRQVLPCLNRHLQPPLRSEASLGRF